MKKIVLLTTGLLLAGIMSAQEVTKDTIKELIGSTKSKGNSMDDQFASVAQMLDSKSFVVEASSLNDKWGNQNFVNSTLNFVMVDSTQSIIQVGDDSGVGSNGVGGVTVKGSISGWKLKKDEKRKVFSLEMNVISPLGIYNVFFDISAFGNASATISNMSSNKVTFRGQIVPLDETRTYIVNHL